MHKLSDAYKCWHGTLSNLPRLSRYTIGVKIDSLFTETIELILLASFSSKHDKRSILEKAAAKFDALKFFLQLAWEMKLVDHKAFARLSQQLAEIGKMLGGWMKHAR